MLRALDAAWFAVLVLYAIQILHQRPGGYGLLLAFGALAATAGIRAVMLAGAIPIAAVMTLLAWRHR